MLQNFMDDIHIFFDELSETHNIDGNGIDIIIDNDRLMHRSKKEYDGLSVGDLLIFVKVCDMPKVPKEDMIIIFDYKPMQVFSVRRDVGIYEIILNQNVSG